MHGGGDDPHIRHAGVIFKIRVFEITMRDRIIKIGTGDHPPRLIDVDRAVDVDQARRQSQHKQKQSKQDLLAMKIQEVDHFRFERAS